MDFLQTRTALGDQTEFDLDLKVTLTVKVKCLNWTKIVNTLLVVDIDFY